MMSIVSYTPWIGASRNSATPCGACVTRSYVPGMAMGFDIEPFLKSSSLPETPSLSRVFCVGGMSFVLSSGFVTTNLSWLASYVSLEYSPAGTM